MLKIDQATSIHLRGRYVKICVEIDLCKKLVPQISVLDNTLNIVYEGLHLIYFSYEKYGHKFEQCSEDGGHKANQPVVEAAGEKEGSTMIREVVATNTGRINLETLENHEHNDEHIVHRTNQEPPYFGPG
ncbi:hypothetical protein Ahy_A10g046796 [Arachis hypogaea]|uniref:Uncharacterized protein n=2 Tax=Arachis hypogaea TaxID=3818 RepID=A0A445B0M3_ARAHY|nr:hypothetical protein Ahy_A10g046796 [Arachis hypogaea]